MQIYENLYSEENILPNSERNFRIPSNHSHLKINFPDVGRKKFSSIKFIFSHTHNNRQFNMIHILSPFSIPCVCRTRS